MRAPHDDPFGTAALRRRVLDVWTASPARFREDANAEDDLVRGGYRDRVVVELAQNAADAAARAGRPGRLLLTLADGMLTASNTGTPLDAVGIESLSTLRASAKRDGVSTGRFGVGFASVLAVTDAPEVVSTTGAVRWDADLARTAVADVEVLTDEASRRAGQLPVLRLPWPSSGVPATGFTTSVRLPLRDTAATDLVRTLLSEVDDALLLALPALDEVVVEVDGERRVIAGADRWQVVRRSGAVEPALLADRPVEERDRPWWSLAWALPLAGQQVPAVLYAPTPTDEPLELPALLLGSFPLDPSRRHVAPGPLTDALVRHAADAYVELASGTADPLALLPAPVPVGRLDGALRQALLAAIREAPVLLATDGARVAPRHATAVVGAGAELRLMLAEALGPLVPDHPALVRLGARRLPLAEVVEALADLDRPAAWWRDLYAALDEDGVRDPDVLTVLPVPLADGRLVRGPRGVLLPGADLAAGTGLAAFGLRLAHPAAVHPLLRRAGASDAGARTVLESPEVRGAVEAAWDEPDPLSLAAIVLPLVAAARLQPGELPWLSGLPLPDDQDEPAPADELVLPGSVLAGLADPDAVGVVADDAVQRWGDEVLAAVGVLAALSVIEVEDVVLDAAAADERLADWVAAVLHDLPPTDVPPTARSVLLVPDLDVVADDRWPAALRVLSSDRWLREAVVTPVRLELGDGRSRTVPSYAGWLLRTRALLDGRPAHGWALPGSGLDGLYDVLGPALVDGVDPAVLAAAGVRVGLADVLAGPGGPDELLDRLADPDRPVPAATLAEVWSLLAETDPELVSPPSRLRVAPDRVVDAAAVVVVDAPEHLQVLPADEALLVPLELAERLAEVLDLDRSSEVLAAPDLSGGSARPVTAAVVGLVAGLPATWHEHDGLVADGVPVAWWRGPDGVVHAATVDGLARGLAAAAGRWEARLLIAAVLADPARAGELRAEALLDR